MSSEAPGLTDAFVRAGRVLLVFGGLATLGVVAVAPALVPVYLGFQYGQLPGYEQYRELIALAGISATGMIAFFFSRPVFAYGVRYIGKWA